MQKLCLVLFVLVRYECSPGLVKHWIAEFKLVSQESLVVRTLSWSFHFRSIVSVLLLRLVDAEGMSCHFFSFCCHEDVPRGDDGAQSPLQRHLRRNAANQPDHRRTLQLTGASTCRHHELPCEIRLRSTECANLRFRRCYNNILFE